MKRPGESLGNFLAPTATGWQFTHDLVRVAAYEGLPFPAPPRAAHASRYGTRRGRSLPTNFPTGSRFALGFEPRTGTGRGTMPASLATRPNLVGERRRRYLLHARGRSVAPLPLSATEVLSVAEALGDVSELSGLYPHARDAYRRARRLARDPDRARLKHKTRQPPRARRPIRRGTVVIHTRAQDAARGPPADRSSVGRQCRADHARRGVGRFPPAQWPFPPRPRLRCRRRARGARPR